MNEAIDTIRRYFGQSETVVVRYQGKGIGIKQFKEVFPNGINDDQRPDNLKDSPDLYIKKGNTVYIIEHFEFDCYKGSKKGSKFRTEEARIDRRFQQIVPTTEGVTALDIIKGERSYSNYLNNVKSLFNRHYEHIPDYIQNLTKAGIIEDGSEIKVVFFIEDVTPLGTRVYPRKGEYVGYTVPITLAESSEFLEFFKSKKKVDYVLSCSSVNNKDYIWFIDNSEIDEYFKITEDYHDLIFSNSTPFVIESQIEIPINNTQKK